LRKYYGPTWRAFRLALIAAHGAICTHCGREVAAYLNLAHLDHDPRSPRTALLCPACHNRHDAAFRLAVYRRNRARRDGQMWLLAELEYAPYPAWLVPRNARAAVDLAQGDLF
jgi:hypothetical protein